MVAEERGEDKDPLLLLGGTGLRVYLFMLQASKPVGVREVQRRLGFRSPSTAKHHLERLVELGLAEKTPQGYTAKKPSGLLSAYTILMGRFVPRSLGVALFASVATITYTVLPGSDPAASIVMAVLSAILLYESIYSYLSMRRILRS